MVINRLWHGTLVRRTPLLLVVALVLTLAGSFGRLPAGAAPAGSPAGIAASFQDDDDGGGGGDDGDDGGGGGGGGGDDGGGGGDDDGFDDDDGAAAPAAVAPIVDDDGDPTTDGYRASQAVLRLRDGAAVESFNLRQGTWTLAAMPERGLYLVEFLTPEPAPEAIARFAGDPDIAWIELNHVNQAPEGRPGYIFVTGQPTAGEDTGYAGELLGLDAVRDCASGGGGIVVAVLDTGVDAGHPDLVGRVLARGVNVFDGTADAGDRGNGLDDDDDGNYDEMTGHGTHVAGIILRVAPAATILPVKVLDSDGVGHAFLLADGIYRAIAAGADVINLSLSSTAEARVVQEALSAAAQAGVVVVAAVGNADRSSPPEQPAAHPAVLAIAATDADDHKTDFSNYGPHVALAAPGTSISSTIPGGGYGVWSGTSMATPFVAGAAALLLAESPAMTPPELRDRLTATAVDIDAANPDHAGALGAGRLDVAAALACT